MNGDIQITFSPWRVSGRVTRGCTILEAARILGLPLEVPCNGAGTCRKDLVQLRRGKCLETVLACRTLLHEDAEVIIPAHDGRAGLKVVEGYFGESRPFPIASPLTKRLVRAGGGAASTWVLHGGQCLTVEEGDSSEFCHGVALDIGTTTLAASLVDLRDGSVLARSSTLNPLVHYGHDVMSRIRFACAESDGLQRMHRELLSAVNLLVGVMSADSGINAQHIYMLVAAGNTTMQHIFLDEELTGIGEYPYRAKVLETFTTSAESLGLGICGKGRVLTLPCMSAYVGGDIVAGLVAVSPEADRLPALFIDIGTNGEMALVKEDGMVATSCAAGPCFEGMSISCGMRAGAGAIEKVSLDGGIFLDVIGGGEPKGLCGSGLLDALAELLNAGLVNGRGRLQDRDSAPEGFRKMLFEKDGKRHFRLSADVALSQDDIRQVQLARAAIRSGVEFLLQESDTLTDELRSVIIAGGFGYHLNLKSLLRVGLLPECPNARFSFVGNSSLEGARRVLLHDEFLDRASRLSMAAQVLELGILEGFEKRFVKEMGFT